MIACIALLILLGGICLAAGEEAAAAKGGDELYEELSSGLQRAEELVADIALQDEAMLTGQEMEELAALNRQIRGSLYGDLIDRSDLLLLLTQEQMRIRQDSEQLQFRLDQMLLQSREEERGADRDILRTKALRSSFTTSLVSFTLAFAFWSFGEIQDRQYFQATSVPEATRHRRLFQILSFGSMIGAAVGVVGAGVSVALYK